MLCERGMGGTGYVGAGGLRVLGGWEGIVFEGWGAHGGGGVGRSAPSVRGRRRGWFGVLLGQNGWVGAGCSARW